VAREKSEAAAARRRENREAEQAELEKIKAENRGRTAPKTTRAEIERRRAEERAAREREEAAAAAAAGVVMQDPDAPLEANPNRDTGADLAAIARGDLVSAGSVEDAVAQLSVDEPADRHPEKRVKAAYRAYEEARLPELRAENPGLRLTQVKDLLWKEFQNHPDNPMVQKRERELKSSLS
jgi:Coiled-coil domain-containing protein 124 /Oxs1